MSILDKLTRAAQASAAEQEERDRKWKAETAQRDERYRRETEQCSQYTLQYCRPATIAEYGAWLLGYVDSSPLPQINVKRAQHPTILIPESPVQRYVPQYGARAYAMIVPLGHPKPRLSSGPFDGLGHNEFFVMDHYQMWGVWNGAPLWPEVAAWATEQPQDLVGRLRRAIES